nr:hypothetical protein HmN_000347400 [Hymenolepis microstoma]
MWDLEGCHELLLFVEAVCLWSRPRFPLHSIQFPFQSQRQCNTSCHVEAHDGVAKGAGAEKGGDGNGGVSGGGGDDGDNDDNNNDVFDEAANQLSRSKLEQYDCKTLFTRTLLIKHH